MSNPFLPTKNYTPALYMKPAMHCLTAKTAGAIVRSDDFS